MPTKKSPTRSPRGRPAVARKSAAGSSSAGLAQPSVILRFLDAPPITIPILLGADEIETHATEWNYRLRDRRRWSTRGASATELRTDAHSFLTRLNISDESIRKVGSSRLVQVDLSLQAGEAAQALRSLPWEYLLAASTKPIRGEAPFTVVRRVRDATSGPPRTRSNQWLMVQSAPGILKENYGFTAECEVLDRSARASGAVLRRIIDPTLAELTANAARRNKAYDVVHLAGFDVHQGMELVRAQWSGRWALDVAGPSRVEDEGEGYILANDMRAPQPVPSAELAQAICGRRKPHLVTCNIFNSAYHIARTIVESGADSAIGFQDTFDEQLAEQFFATFFRAWQAAGWDTVSAFNYAWEQIRSRNVPLQGSGVVLWTRQRVDDSRLITEATIRESDTKRPRVHKPPELTAENVRDLLEVTAKPLAQLNYSILHNNGPLFETFVIKKKDSRLGQVSNIVVSVELHVGTDAYPFRTTVGLGYSEPESDLKRDVRVSLASTLNRALRENVRTSMFIEVKWRDVTLLQRTEPVTLLSVDEWRDDDLNRKWLPSFVLPRDPVVPQIIDRAQKYLMALLDDSTAGFDGYQSVADDPGRRNPSTECEPIDLQVRAIWSALIHDTPLAYINPPPTFTDQSQRLRTPSDVVVGKRGTCIDLALLLASCLEYVEIYPVVILLKTHAFPAYWRHHVYHEKFSQARIAQEETGGESMRPRARVSSGQLYSWYFTEPHHYLEMMAAVQAGRLVPLETVFLTQRAGFFEALAEGHKNLGNRREFDSMLDVQLARSDERWRVTPLPILRSES